MLSWRRCPAIGPSCTWGGWATGSWRSPRRCWLCCATCSGRKGCGSWKGGVVSSEVSHRKLCSRRWQPVAKRVSWGLCATSRHNSSILGEMRGDISQKGVSKTYHRVFCWITYKDTSYCNLVLKWCVKHSMGVIAVQIRWSCKGGEHDEAARFMPWGCLRADAHVSVRERTLGFGFHPLGAMLFLALTSFCLAAMKLFRKTRLLIGPHGAAFTNMVFMPLNASVFEMRPRGWPKGCYRQLAAVCSLQYFSVWGEGNKTTTLTLDLVDVKAKLEHIRSHLLQH